MSDIKGKKTKSIFEKQEERLNSDAPVHSKTVMPYEFSSASYVMHDAQEWYRSVSKYALLSFVASLFLCSILVIVLGFVLTQEREVKSFLRDEDGRIVQLQPVHLETLTETEVLNWASKKILQAHQLSFADYMDHIYSQQSDFTRQAFIEYQRALLDSKSLAKVKEKRLVMSAEPIEAPRIIKKGLAKNGAYTWIVQMRISQKIEGGEYSSQPTKMLSTITIQRTLESKNLSGVVVSKYLAKEIQ